MSEPMHNWPASQWAIYYGKKADEAQRAKRCVRHAQARTPPMNSNEKRVRLE